MGTSQRKWGNPENKDILQIPILHRTGKIWIYTNIYYLQVLSQDHISNLKLSIMPSEIEAVIKNPPTKISLAPDCFYHRILPDFQRRTNRNTQNFPPNKNQRNIAQLTSQLNSPADTQTT